MARRYEAYAPPHMDGATLSLVLERLAEDIHEPEFVAYSPLVRFEAYLSRQRMSGWLRLDAQRLTDLLNAHEVIHLANVTIEDHGDGRSVSADEALLRRSEIRATLASGPRGDPAHRLTTSRHPVVVDSGVYRIGGYVHVAPGMEPGDRFQLGDPMVPLTEAWLEYGYGARRRRHEAVTVIVNRLLATRIEVRAEPVVPSSRPPHP